MVVRRIEAAVPHSSVWRWSDVFVSGLATAKDVRNPRSIVNPQDRTRGKILDGVEPETK